jgi:mono/diheme cytochrome c family protein
MNPKKNKNRKPGKGMLLIFSLVFLSVCIAFNAEAQKSSWVVPASAAHVKNPLAGNTSVLGDAKVLYVGNCAPCHGKGGKGNGPAAAALKVKPADHTSAKIQSMSDGSLYWMIATGQTPMPSYKTALTTKQKWELVNYIRTLAKK